MLKMLLGSSNTENLTVQKSKSNGTADQTKRYTRVDTKDMVMVVGEMIIIEDSVIVEVEKSIVAANILEWR